jgi:hypothetical protein
MNTLNVFTRYEQNENRFTNGFFSVLRMATLDNPRFLTSFLRGELGRALGGRVHTFRVLREIQGTPDGELCGDDFRIQFETKIVSGSLRRDQIRAHLKHLQVHRERLKRLVLLTPDDSNSSYIKEFTALDPTRILHLGWKRVYNALKDSVARPPRSSFTELVRQFLEQIQERVFKQDFAGIIQKIDFGDRSGVDHNAYLKEMETGE